MKDCDPPRPDVQSVEARIMRPQPKRPNGVFCEGKVALAAAPLPVDLVRRETACVGIKTIQAVVGCDPQCPGSIDEHLMDFIVTQACRIARIMLVEAHDSGRRIVAAETVRECPKPNLSLSVPKHGDDHRLC